METIGILGAGAMGSGIAQVAASAGHKVVICDNLTIALTKSSRGVQNTLKTLVDKGKISDADSYALFSKLKFTDHMSDFRDCTMIIEAIVEDIEQKQIALQKHGGHRGRAHHPGQQHFLLVHFSHGRFAEAPRAHTRGAFFNPAPLMRLVEIIPGLQTSPEVLERGKAIIDTWGKTTVVAKDTPGFIVNRVARPYYGEALRIYDEGIADEATIDWAMRELCGFRMGPFELMDFIGNDINYAVTEVVFTNFFYDPRYKPSFTQKRLVDAHYFGRKTGRGFYQYGEGTVMPQPNKDEALGREIASRILAMLINEAADALYLRIASRDDIELAMTQGVNYPKGLLAWADEIGVPTIVQKLDSLYVEYLEDRYRCSPLLRKMNREGRGFFD
jgi:3-hydroxyacyl-CoA dehydrogenase